MTITKTTLIQWNDEDLYELDNELLPINVGDEFCYSPLTGPGEVDDFGEIFIGKVTKISYHFNEDVDALIKTISVESI